MPLCLVDGGFELVLDDIGNFFASNGGEVFRRGFAHFNDSLHRAFFEHDVDFAKHVAKKIRESSGGLPFVKALGIDLYELGIVQVSMNLTNYRVTAPEKVYGEIKKYCDDYGTEILESEVVGLIPGAAYKNEHRESLKLIRFSENQIFENRLAEVMNAD